MTKFNSTMADNVTDNLTLPSYFKELFKKNFELLVCFLCLLTLAVICFMLTTLFRTGFRLPIRHVDMRVTGTDVGRRLDNAPMLRQSIEVPTSRPMPTPENPTLHLPDFWEFNPRGYFHSVDLLFNSNNIICELTRYSILLQTLSKSKSVLQRMSDILASIDRDTPYTTLKTAMIQRYTSQSSGCLQSILNECHRGNKTVSKYLIQLRSQLGEHYDTHSLLHTDLLRHKLLESLDPQSRLCLYHYENEPLECLARHADQILSRTTSLHNSPTDMVASNQQLINESVEAKLGSIEQSIAKLNQTDNSGHIERNTAASNQRGSYSERTPSRFVPPQRRVIQFSSGAQNDLCRYHTRYGERAFRCEGPSCSLHQLVASQAQHRTTTSHQQTKNASPVSIT